VAVWIGLGFLAIGWISFVVWRKMRMDYEEEQILSLAMLMAVGMVGAGIAANLIVYGQLGLVRGVAMVMGIDILWWWCRRKSWDFWEWLDVWTGWGLFLLMIWSLIWGPERFAYALGYGLAWIITLIAAANYRKFRWYKSGRVGFVGLFALMMWSGTEIVVAMVRRVGIYWGGLTPEQWFAVWILTASVVNLYLRSGRKMAWRTKR
jgi:hypothetical protein